MRTLNTGPQGDPIDEPQTPDTDDQEEWDSRHCRACGDALEGLGPLACPACIEAGACAVCGLGHRAWACPDVAVVKAEMAAADELARQESVAQYARAIYDRYVAWPIYQEAA